jgi:hypothetical protein
MTCYCYCDDPYQVWVEKKENGKEALQMFRVQRTHRTERHLLRVLLSPQ